MGVALGLIAIALAGAAGESKAGVENVQIQYTVRFLETEGMGWRTAVFTRLTPVTRQGAATVWTAPGNVKQRLLQQAIQHQGARLVQAPVITGWNGSPVHFSIRDDRRLVTQVAWDGNDRPAAAKPETVRTGPVGTMVGRKIDQGVLVQLVLEDTEIRAVHRVPLGGSTEPRSSPETKKAAYHVDQCTESPACCQSVTSPTASSAHARDDWEKYWSSDEPSRLSGDAVRAAFRSHASGTKADEVSTVSIEVPEIASQEIAGEWLIPKDGVLLVSFGPHTVAGKDGKAVVRERLAIIEAEGIADGAVQRTSPATGFFSFPRDVTPYPTATPRPIPAPPGAGNPPATFPALPSRSIPQGIHADGTPAELPPLPADIIEDASSSESAEPRPSPQTKKPQQPPKPGPVPVPAPDSQMKRTGFNATSMLSSIPSMFLGANSTVGFQFLVPIKAVSFQLPFNRRLEIEVLGRVVPNSEPAELAAKPKTSKSR